MRYDSKLKAHGGIGDRVCAYSSQDRDAKERVRDRSSLVVRHEYRPRGKGSKGGLCNVEVSSDTRVDGQSYRG